MDVTSVTLTGTMRAGDVRAALAGLALNLTFVRPVRVGPVRLPENGTVAEVLALLDTTPDDDVVQVDMAVGLDLLRRDPASLPRLTPELATALLDQYAKHIGAPLNLTEPYVRTVLPLAHLVAGGTVAELTACLTEAFARMVDLYNAAVRRSPTTIHAAPAEVQLPPLALVPDPVPTSAPACTWCARREASYIARGEPEAGEPEYHAKHGHYPGCPQLVLLADAGEDPERFPVAAPPASPREALGFVGTMPAGPPADPLHIRGDDE